MKEKILQISHISYAYHTMQGEIPVINDLSLHIDKGEFISIVGPSGCGKTTLLNLLTSLLTPESGSITKNYSSLGYMLQQDHLFEWYSIWDNVCLGHKIKHTLSAQTQANILKLLEQYGLSAYKDKRPSELSGGMRQRAALIRTLATDPELLLLDEPFSALDYQTRLNCADDIGKIIKAEHKTALLVTHDIGEAISLSSRILVLSKRPTNIIKELSIPFYKTNLSPLEVRNHSDFPYYFNSIWKEMNQYS